MHRLIILLVLAVAAAGAAALASGSRTAGGGATAFALVDPNHGVPRLVAARTRGFAAVSSPATGVYCLTPSPGVDVTGTAPVASEEAYYSNELGWPLVRLPQPDARNCAADQLEVKTFAEGTTLSSEVAFTLLVP
jgi:hypothetical protein